MKRFLNRLFAACSRSANGPRRSGGQRPALKVQSHLKAGKDAVDGVENDGPNHR
jgi:hypothetical protein